MKIQVNGFETQVTTGGRALDDPALDHKAPVMVLVHGAGMDSSVWFLQTRYLAYKGIRVAAVDLPGHGRSQGQALNSIEEMADWLAEFLDVADLKGSHLVGHSMGTFVALETARRHPGTAASLVLMGTAGAMPVHPELLAAATDDVDRAAALMTGWSHARSSHLSPHPTPGLSMTGGARALVGRSQPGVLASDLAACASYDGAESAAHACDVPIQIVMGEADKMTPAKAGAALASATKAASITITNAGHMMMIEQSAEVRTALVDWVRAS